MKRISAIIVLAIIMVITAATAAFAADDELKVDRVTPDNGATGMALDNMGFKVYFNQDVYKKSNQKANKKLCKMVDNKGKEVPSIVVFNPDEKNVMMVLADTTGKDAAEIKGETEYTLNIDEGFTAESGAELEKKFTSSFTTQNPSTSMKISMGMMAVMVVAMIFFGMREKNKENDKSKEKQKKKPEKVNPYKEAKETGKSVEEIVARENKKKAKAEAKRKRQEKENKVEIASENFRVKEPRKLSSVGIKYKEVPDKKEKQTNQKRNQPGSNKNKTGKQKNQQNRKKKK